ncbi:Hypothetical protein CINCED_3A004894 [Cinara cedri]|uniref:Uncharacterized protein n=1 Tax=Cinara cedri TaxID=506608 RepID=A0A5E4MIN5_9HEMI|nr:Hypothetical protein CINCED_3A004894 [Cinara cedri]
MNRPQCRIVIPAAEKKCAGVASAIVIKSGLNGLIEAVCRLHDRWRVGPMALNREFNDELRELVHLLKCLDKDLNNSTAGTCDQLALLAEQHNQAWDRYYTLLARLNGHRKDDGSGRHVPSSTRNRPSRDRARTIVLRAFCLLFYGHISQTIDVHKRVSPYLYFTGS